MSCSSGVASQLGTTSQCSSMAWRGKDAGEQLELLCEERTSTAGNRPEEHPSSRLGLSRPAWSAVAIGGGFLLSFLSFLLASV